MRSPCTQYLLFAIHPKGLRKEHQIRSALFRKKSEVLSSLPYWLIREQMRCDVLTFYGPSGHLSAFRVYFNKNSMNYDLFVRDKA